jgi:hypothetical protein
MRHRSDAERERARLEAAHLTFVELRHVSPHSALDDMFVYVARCSCGWASSAQRDNDDAAEHDATDHVVAITRAQS